jgi:hypothetical protein
VSQSANALALPKLEQGLSPSGWIEALKQRLAFGPETGEDTLSERVGAALAEKPEQAAAAVAALPSECRVSDRLASGVALTGDQLAVRFFESGESGGSDDQPVFFERLDLSGSYQVDVEGEVSIPLVGRIAAEGQTLACLEARIAARYVETFATPVSVSAAFAARPPVVVTGAVRMPGSYQAGPGMTLRHILALAGARTGIAAADPGLASILARKDELERLRAGLRLELRGLEAAKAEVATLELSPGERSRLAEALGPTRIESELDSLAGRVTALHREERERATKVETGQAAVALLLEEQERLRAQVAEKRGRLDELRTLTERGLAPLTRLTADEAALIALERAAFDVDRDLLLKRAELAAAERASAETRTEYHEALATETRGRARELDAIDAQLASIDLQLGLLQEEDPRGEGSYTIVRMERGAELRLEGTLASPVLPGDLIEVERSRTETH